MQNNCRTTAVSVQYQLQYLYDVLQAVKQVARQPVRVQPEELRQRVSHDGNRVSHVCSRHDADHHTRPSMGKAG